MARSDEGIIDVRSQGRDGGAPAIERALAVIEMLAEEADGLTLSDISRKLDVNKAIVHRVLSALDATGYVFRSERTGNYRLTYKIRNIGLRHVSLNDLLEQNMPILQALADMTDELIRLAVVESNSITWIAAVQGRRRMLQLNPSYTFGINLHTHATGKAWLSTLPRDVARSLLEKKGLHARTGQSKTNLADIEAELDEALFLGYAVTYEEDELGVGALAAPIVLDNSSPTALCVGIISLAGPTSRMNREQLVATHPLVIAAAQRLAMRWPRDAVGKHLLSPAPNSPNDS
jgi:IclR family transcriptional regulator, acetate operon repressor